MLIHHAIAGDAAHSKRIGNAENNEIGEVTAIAAAAPIAITGAIHIDRKKVSKPVHSPPEPRTSDSASCLM